MSVRTDVINLQVNINGNEAQNKLNELRKKAGEISLAMDGLKKNTQEYIDKKKELATVTAEMDNLKKQIGITALSQKELTAELNKLKALRASTVAFTEEYKAFSKQIKEVENRLYDVRNGVQGFASFFSKIKDEVKQFGALALGALGFQFLTSQFQNIIKGAGKLSDQLADLRRVAGLTAEEATNLNSKLSKIDTRTAVGSLRDIAIIAGKLGVAKGDIFGFTEAVDKLVVSLGDELGNADQITTQLGKILNVFDGKVNGDNITKLGNAFVTLANAGVATGGFIAEFDQRLSGTAKSAGISLGALTGLGAGLEELGNRVESSSTAIQKLVTTIGQDVPKAAKIAGAKSAEEIAKFAEIFAKRPEEAIIQFGEGLTKNKNSFAEIATSFKDAGEEGTRIVAVLQDVGQRSDFIRSKIDLGNKSIRETSAITEAFALKNETFGASLDKLSKEFNKLVSGTGINNFFQGIAQGAINFIEILKAIPKFIDDNSTALKLLAAGIVLMNLQYIRSAYFIGLETAIKVQNAIATRLTAAANAVAQVAVAAYIVVTNLLTGSITAATAAQRLWAIALSVGLGPLGIIITAVGALVIGIGVLIGKTNELNIQQKAQAEIAKRAADSYSDEVNKLELLKGILISTNYTLDEKKKAYEELIKIHPEFAKTLTLDTNGHLQGAEAIDKYIAALKKKGEAQAAQELSNELYKQQIKQQKEVDDLTPKSKKTGILKTILQFATDDELRQEALERAKKNLEQIKKEKAYYDSKIAEGIKELAKSSNGNGTGSAAGAATQAVGIIKNLEDRIKALKEALPNLGSQKEINANLRETAKLQAELDAILGKKSKADKKDASDLEKLRKEAEAFAKELTKLKNKAQAGELTEDAKEIALVEENHRVLLDKAKKYWIKHTGLGKQAYEDIEAIHTAELNALYKKFFAKGTEENYKESLQEAETFVSEQKAIYAKSFIDGKLSKQQYEAAIASADEKGLELKVASAKYYAEFSKKAATDLTTFLRQQLDKQVADALVAAEKKKKDTVNDILAEAQLEVLKQPKGSDARLEAEKLYLKLKYEYEVKNADDTLNMKLLKEKQLQDEIAALDRQANVDKIDRVVEYIGYFQQALSSLSTIIANKENKELQKDKANNDKKKTQFKNQLDGKLISQAQHDKLVEKLNLEQEKKEKEIKIRQAKREKALNLFNAIISGAVAVAKTLASVPFPANIPLAILQGIASGLQIAAIASAPLPELGRGGHIANGPKHSHSSRGLHLVNPLTGKTEMLLEQNEAVINSNAMNSSQRMTVTGTPKQIASAINSSTGGVSFASGALVSMGWHNRPQAQIRPGIVSMMAQGGIINTALKDEANNYSTAQLEALQMVAGEMRQVREDLKQFPRELTSKVIYKDVQKVGSDYEAARAASGF